MAIKKLGMLFVFVATLLSAGHLYAKTGQEHSSGAVSARQNSFSEHQAATLDSQTPLYSFNYPDFSSAAGLQLMGGAVLLNNKLRLTPTAFNLTAAAWYTATQYVQDSFTTTFQFQITNPVNGGADGLAFVIQRNSLSSLGCSGTCIGYEGIPVSLAVEFDTFQYHDDPSDNHISVHTRGSLANSSRHAYSLGSTSAIPNLSDGNIHTARITYTPGHLRVFVDNLAVPALSVPVSLTQVLGSGQAWVGFTSGTGSAYEYHDILNWSFESSPPPAGEPLGGRVLVVYNTSYLIDENNNGVPDSREIALYYQQARNVPAVNVLGIIAPTVEEITRPQYDAAYDTGGAYAHHIKQDIEQYLSTTYDANGVLLKDKIYYIVLTKGIPLKIKNYSSGGTTCSNSSVDAALVFLFQGSICGSKSNPYYDRDPAASLNHPFHNFYGSTTKLSYLVTRLDAFTVEDVKAMINRSLAADKSGNYTWVLDDDPTPQGRLGSYARMAAAYGRLLRLNQQTRYDISERPVLTDVNSVMGYVSHGRHSGLPADYILNSLNFRYANGALFTTYESFNAWSFIAGNRPTFCWSCAQGLIGDFIQKGGTGGIGNVYEPFVSGIANESILFSMYAAGYTLAEAAYMSMSYLNWQNTVVGDPLCRIADPPAPSNTCYAQLGNQPGVTYNSVQAAIDAATPGDVVKVAGYCTGVHSRTGITQTVYISKNLTLRGGYTFTNWIVSNPLVNPTTLDAQRQGRVIYITGTHAVTIEGLRITGGDSHGLGGGTYWGTNAGGGMYVMNATVTVNDCQILHNAAYDGGGIFVRNGLLTLQDTWLTKNNARHEGGALEAYISNVTIRNCSITDNVADASGGLNLRYTPAAITNSVIARNIGRLYAGVYLESSNARITNSVVADNQLSCESYPYSKGSGMTVFASAPQLLHTTFARNAGCSENTIYIAGENIRSHVSMTNTIIAGQHVSITVAASNTLRLNGVLWSGSNVYLGGGGQVFTLNAYTGEPAFGSDGYHLMSNSAAIDRGIETGLSSDIDGDLRPQGAAPDLGADEYGTGAATYGISLATGWNLVSLPVHPASTNITHVLNSLTGQYSLVYAYNGCDVADPWKKYDPNAPPYVNDLTQLDETRGFWIKMNMASTLTVTGTNPSPQAIALCTGWNLVGYPRLQAQPIATALASIAGRYSLVYAYDASDTNDPWKKYDPNAPPYANDLTEMRAGVGYWIKVNQNCSWTLP